MARLLPALNTLMDLTTYWNGKSWTSRFPELVASFTGWTNSLPGIVKAMNDDYARYGTQTASMSTRLQKLGWYYKFNKNPNNLLILFTFISPYLKSFVPFYLTTGRTLRLVHGEYRKLYELTLPKDLMQLPEEDRVSAAFGYVQTFFIEAVAEDYVTFEQTRLCSEEQERANQTIQVAFDFITNKKGPLSKGTELRYQLPSLEEMLVFLEENAPLYDIDVPSVVYNLPGYDTIKRYNDSPDPGVSKRSRVNSQVHAPHFTTTQTEATAAVECIYSQIIWYQHNNIEPNYLWVEDVDGNRLLCTKREAKYLKGRSITRMSDGTPSLQELFS